MSNVPEKRENKSAILFYQTEDGQSRIEVRLENETVWLSQNLLAELFQTSVPNISMHIRNVLKEGELRADSVVKDFLTTAADGKTYEVAFYNLDMIIAIGYRVRSHRGTQLCDIYQTSVDYDPSAEMTQLFFQTEFEKFDRQRRQLEDAQADTQFAQGVETLAKKAKQLKPPKTKQKK